MTFLSLSWYEMYTKLGTETNELKKEKIESLKKIFTILNIVIYVLFLFQSLVADDLTQLYEWQLFVYVIIIFPIPITLVIYG